VIVMVVRNYDDVRRRYRLDFAWGPCRFCQELEWGGGIMQSSKRTGKSCWADELIWRASMGKDRIIENPRASSSAFGGRELQ
jgi:hypothetical protein